MPVTGKIRQKRTNRKNAQKSTGPLTAEGKAASSRNAIKHGLYAQDIIIDSPHLREDRAEYDFLVASLKEELKPTTLLQRLLVVKMANCLWRSRRAITAETAQIDCQLDDIDADSERRYHQMIDHFSHRQTPNLDDKVVWLVANKARRECIPYPDSAIHILRYEMRLDRQLNQAYQMLRQLQRQQQAESPADQAPDHNTPGYTTAWVDEETGQWKTEFHPVPPKTAEDPTSDNAAPDDLSGEAEPGQNEKKRNEPTSDLNDYKPERYPVKTDHADIITCSKNADPPDRTSG